MFFVELLQKKSLATPGIDRFPIIIVIFSDKYLPENLLEVK